MDSLSACKTSTKVLYCCGSNKSYFAIAQPSALFGSLSIGKARSPSFRQALLSLQDPEKNSTTKPTSSCRLQLTEFGKRSGLLAPPIHSLSKLAPDALLSSPPRDAPVVTFSTCQDPAFEWQAAAPCFGLRQRMHVWKPNLHRPFLIWLLHPLLKLKCQHIGLPSAVLSLRPLSSSGIFAGSRSLKRGFFCGCPLGPPLADSFSRLVPFSCGF